MASQQFVQIYNIEKRSKLPPSHSDSGVAIAEKQLTLTGSWDTYCKEKAKSSKNCIYTM